MSIWPVLARHAKRLRFSRALLLFLGVQIFLFIPVAYALLKTPPNEMYLRLNAGAVIGGESFTVTDEEIVFTGGGAVMAIIRSVVPERVIDERDYPELFNYLALSNGYFANVYAPVALLVFAGFFVTQLLFYFCAAWLFGQTRIITDYMTLGERFNVTVIASMAAMLPAAAVGFFAPLIHVLLFEAAVTYITYKTLGEY